MPFRRYLCLVVLLGICFASNANAATRLADFFGFYLGFGMATDRTGPNFRTERDLRLTIGPLGSQGLFDVPCVLLLPGSVLRYLC